jgi:hypothetical protein
VTARTITGVTPALGLVTPAGPPPPTTPSTAAQSPPVWVLRGPAEPRGGVRLRTDNVHYTPGGARRAAEEIMNDVAGLRTLHGPAV